MREEEKIFRGELFWPADPELKAIKLRAHKLSSRFSRLDEDDAEERRAILDELLGAHGPSLFMQGPIFFHYGKHTRIGDRFFANYNLTVQDDAPVTIGEDVNFGPNVTIVTPIHPMLPDERELMINEAGEEKRLCYAKPVSIGNHVWLCANVVVCSGVTIGDGAVIGAGSVVTRDIPASCFAAGNPARVIRVLTEKDSMRYKPDILGENRVIEKETEQ